MHEFGNQDPHPSRFKLPLDGTEGPPGQQELRELFFTGVEESLDITGTPFNGMPTGRERETYHAQLEYALALSEIGEHARAEQQFDSALASDQAGLAYDEIVIGKQRPHTFRGQAIALATAAAKLQQAGWPERARAIADEAISRLERALEPDGEEEPRVTTERSHAEPRTILTVAAQLASLSVDESEAWRQQVDVVDYNPDTYALHLEVLRQQHEAVSAAEEAQREGIKQLQRNVLDEVVSSFYRGRIYEAVMYGPEPDHKLRAIRRLQMTAIEYEVEVDVGDLLETLEAELDNPDEETESTYPLMQGYKLLADAYRLAGRTENADAAMAKAVPFIQERVDSGDVPDDLAMAYVELGEHALAEETSALLDIRYRLEIRRNQAERALGENDIEGAVAVLDKAIHELTARLKSGASDIDDLETSMGMQFADMYGSIGEHTRMDGVYSLLEQEDGVMYGDGAALNLSIAKHFAAHGDIARAFSVIRNADFKDERTFLIDMMRITCTTGDRPPEATFIDDTELVVALEEFVRSQQEARSD